MGYPPGHNTPSPYPLTDNGEKTRLNFWREHAKPIPASLLRITGWLDSDPEREVLVQKGGQLDVQRAGDEPQNVLFRIPLDPKGQQQWQWVLFQLRLEQGRRRSIGRQAKTAERLLAQALTQETGCWDDLYQASELAKGAAARGRDAAARRDPKILAESLMELRERVEEARGPASHWRVARRHSEDAERVLRYRRADQQHEIYPGFFALVNSFLDIQALTVASLASDEFRKRTGGRRIRLPAAEPLEREELTIDGP